MVKETQTTQNNSTPGPDDGQPEPPAGQDRPPDGKQSNEENQKREELNNYEVSSKTTTTTSAGYAHRAPVGRGGDQPGGPARRPRRQAGAPMRPTRSWPTSSSSSPRRPGFQKARGDTIKVMAVDFVDGGRDLEPVPSPGIADAVFRQSGTLINALVVLAVTAVVVLFVVRPLIRTLAAGAAQAMRRPSGGDACCAEADAGPDAERRARPRALAAAGAPGPRRT